MKKLVLLMGALLISMQIKAHNPDLSSTMLVEQGKDKWVLQIRAALTAFEYEIHLHYGENAYASPEAFQELVLEFVKENVSILYNEVNVAELQNGMVKLGHETSVTFEVKGTPTSIHTLTFKNSSFEDIPRNQSTLIVLREGYSGNQFTLSNNNSHTVQLKVENSSIQLIDATDKKMYSGGLYILGVLLAFSIIYFGSKKIGNRRPI